MEQCGILCIGLVFGYLLYYSIRHTEKFNISLLSSALGVVGTEAAIGWIKPATPDWLGWYGVGLAGGFFLYLIISVCLISAQKFEEADKQRLLVNSAIGLKAPE